MGDSCALVEARADGTFRGIYCRLPIMLDRDMLAEAAAILRAHYCEPAIVSRLIDLGDLNALGTTPTLRGPRLAAASASDQVIADAFPSQGDTWCVPFRDCPPREGTLESVLDRIDHRGQCLVFRDGTWWPYKPELRT